MAYHHLRTIDWFPKKTSCSADALNETITSPFLIAGGYLEASSWGLRFTNASQDYGDLILNGNVNDLASLAGAVCGLDKQPLPSLVYTACEVNKQPLPSAGEKILLQLAAALRGKFRKPDFYEELYRFLLKSKTADSMTATSLLLMKAVDRAHSENKNFTQMVVEEMQGGFARTLMLTNLSKVFCPTSD